jgi:prenyltransferase beta subunit
MKSCIPVIIAVILFVRPAAGQDQSRDPRVDQAVSRALSFLSKQQNQDGSFEGGGPKVAMTGLTLMAFLADGHTPDVGRYGDAIRASTDYLLSIAREDGYFGRVDGSRMYGHAIATLALAELYGVETSLQNRERIRASLAKSIALILDAQRVKKDAPHAGGWRYEPQSVDSDLSLSAWNLLALRACANIGFSIDKDSIDHGATYVRQCYRDQQHGFAYMPGSEATASMTGVGLLTLYLIDPNEKSIADAISFLGQNAVTDDTRFPYYASYYVTQAAYQAGGATWPTLWARTRDWLLPKQQPDGGFPISRTAEEPGRVYATSMAVLTLAIPYRLLPIYQR